MTAEQFVDNWGKIKVKETAASQTHFNELCELLGVDKPLDVDPTGDFYTFEKHLQKSTTTGKGYADVWYKNHFAWEYKGKRKNLVDAYRQVVAYHEALGNPPLLIVSDIDTIEVHTKFTSTQKIVERFSLEDLLEPEKRARLRKAWTDPQAFNPEAVRALVTEATVRDLLAKVADVLKAKGHNPDEVAHFLVKIVFTMFAEDARLLPKYTFSQLLESAQKHPEDFKEMAEQLFGLMAGGGVSVIGRVPYFNGEIFSDSSAPELGLNEINALLGAARQDWTAVEPSIFGTLFERIIDPAKRAQAGAHYTPPGDILDVIEPVILEPLRGEWKALSDEVEPLIQSYNEKRQGAEAQGSFFDTPLGENEKEEAIVKLRAFLERLSNIKVLDPACGSGNFLYMTMRALMDLEEQVRAKLMLLNLGKHIPTGIHPNQFYGLEFNPYAHEIAGMVLWIGYLQWLRAHGEDITHTPILQKLVNLQHVDAVLDGEEPRAWPAVDYIVGNPPFLGSYKIRGELGDTYTNALRKAYEGKLPKDVDFVCYWFETARRQIECSKAKRVGLISTNSIRGGANQTVLRRIRETGDIFAAWADRPWIQDGAAVRVSIVAFDDATELEKTLYSFSGTDNKKVVAKRIKTINADLTSGTNLETAQPLSKNSGKAFEGVKPAGPFDVSEKVAQSWLSVPNLSGANNSDVLKLYVGGRDVTGQCSNRWIIDFNQLSLEDAQKYQIPFAHVEREVKPVRAENRRKRRREIWWQFGEVYPNMRQAIAPLSRYIATSAVSKHRFFVWLQNHMLPANSLITFAFDDDFTFGVLNSYPHVLWALRLGTSLGKGNDPRYTPSTTFETYPFPYPDGSQKEAIEQAAQHLHNMREHLKTKTGDTLTELYNEVEELKGQAKPNTAHPVYPLVLAHEALDKAVYAAYGWEYPLEDEEILERVLGLNLERAAAQEVGAVSPSDDDAGEESQAAD